MSTKVLSTNVVSTGVTSTNVSTNVVSTGVASTNVMSTNEASPADLGLCGRCWSLAMARETAPRASASLQSYSQELCTCESLGLCTE